MYATHLLETRAQKPARRGAVARPSRSRTTAARSATTSPAPRACSNHEVRLLSPGCAVIPKRSNIHRCATGHASFLTEAFAARRFNAHPLDLTPRDAAHTLRHPRRHIGA